MDAKELLKQQITDSAGNVFYTFSAHWNIVARLKFHYTLIKILQIGLTAMSACGFVASIIANMPNLAWLGGLTSAISLGFNLYMLNFNLPDNIKSHTDAANELWDVRETYKSILVDFDDLNVDQIRKKRDELTEHISQINKKYPGTDDKSFKKAQSDIEKYTFQDGEAAKLLHISEQKEKK